jgi:galactokinase
MSAAAAEDKAALFRAVERELPAFSKAARFRWFVPGRIKVLGRDTRCTGGRSLVCAAERGYCVAAEARSDSFVRIKDVGRGQTFTLQISSHQAPSPDTADQSLGKLLRRLSQDFPTLVHGADISFASDLPSSAGMGNVSALWIAVFSALFTVNRAGDGEDCVAEVRRDEDIAEYLTCVERGESYRSTAQGDSAASMGEEYAAILLSLPRHLKQVASSLGRAGENVALPSQCMFVVAATGVDADEAGPGRASRAEVEISSILDVWRAVSGIDAHSLSGALSSLPDAADRIRDALRSVRDSSEQQRWLSRFEQFYLESEVLIPQAAAALAAGNLARFGEAVDESQASAERRLGTRESATGWLAQQARSLGAHAASTFGGGSVWALVGREDAENFSQRWRKSYAQLPHPRPGFTQFLVTEAGPALVRI